MSVPTFFWYLLFSDVSVNIMFQDTTVLYVVEKYSDYKFDQKKRKKQQKTKIRTNVLRPEDQRRILAFLYNEENL